MFKYSWTFRDKSPDFLSDYLFGIWLEDPGWALTSPLIESIVHKGLFYKSVLPISTQWGQKWVRFFPFTNVCSRTSDFVIHGNDDHPSSLWCQWRISDEEEWQQPFCFRASIRGLPGFARMTREARTSLAIGKVIKMILFIKKNVKEWLSGGPPTSNPVSTAPYLATTHSTLTTCVSHCQ